MPLFELDLSAARSSEPLNLGGEYCRLEVLEAPSPLRLHVRGPGEPGIPLESGRVVLFPPTDQVWISNDAASGTAELHADLEVCVELGGGGGGGDLEGLFEETPSSVPDGATKTLLIDENGRLIVRLGDALSESEDTVGVASASPGTEGNAWDGAGTGAGGNSAAVDVAGGSVVSIFGEVDGATDLSVWWSQDGTNFYQSGETISLAGAGDFGETFRVAAAFVRLQSSNDVIATATVANKP